MVGVIDGRQVVSGSCHNDVCVWDVLTGEKVGPPLYVHKSQVNSVAYSPDGKQITSGSTKLLLFGMRRREHQSGHHWREIKNA